MNPYIKRTHQNLKLLLTRHCKANIRTFTPNHVVVDIDRPSIAPPDNSGNESITLVHEEKLVARMRMPAQPQQPVRTNSETITRNFRNPANH